MPIAGPSGSQPDHERLHADIDRSPVVRCNRVRMKLQPRHVIVVLNLELVVKQIDTVTGCQPNATRGLVGRQWVSMQICRLFDSLLSIVGF